VGVTVVEGYGLTETSPIVACTLPDRIRPGTVGPPIEGVEVRIAEDGEILVRGPNVAAGYWNSPEQSAQTFVGGWYHSGDIGHFDGEGHLYVVARKKDMIISGGENIYPAELEHILLESPAVQEACVVGRPDERWGEAVVAAVVLKPGERMSEAEVLALFQGRIARYKQPREVRFLPQLPRSALGKILKDEVRTAVGQTVAAGPTRRAHGL